MLAKSLVENLEFVLEEKERAVLWAAFLKGNILQMRHLSIAFVFFRAYLRRASGELDDGGRVCVCFYPI